MSQVTGRWKLGLVLAFTTAVFWGVLPLALKLALQGMDSYTVVWYRFAGSGAILGLILTVTRNLPTVQGPSARLWWGLAIALGSLVGNYVLYMLALTYTT